MSTEVATPGRSLVAGIDGSGLDDRAPIRRLGGVAAECPRQTRLVYSGRVVAVKLRIPDGVNQICR